MATGDFGSFIASVKAWLPRGWFPDVDPVAQSAVNAVAMVASNLWEQQAECGDQQRIATASGVFLDLAAEDFFGFRSFKRRANETNESYRARIQANLLRPLGTKQAMYDVLYDLTTYAPTVFEPATDGAIMDQTAFMDDPGARSGSYTIPWQVFIDVRRPPTDIVLDAPSAYDQFFMDGNGFSISNVLFESEIEDDEITQAVLTTAPAGIKPWLQINP
jgi:hypothetical protein